MWPGRSCTEFYHVLMSADGAASIFCFTPLRVPVEPLGPRAAADTVRPAQPQDPPPCSAPLLPTGPCPVCPRLAHEFEPYRQAAYWKAQHQRACQREAQLKEENARLQAL